MVGFLVRAWFGGKICELLCDREAKELNAFIIGLCDIEKRNVLSNARALKSDVVNASMAVGNYVILWDILIKYPSVIWDVLRQTNIYKDKLKHKVDVISLVNSKITMDVDNGKILIPQMVLI